MSDLTTKLIHLQTHLNQGLVGRKPIIQTALLGLLAGENTLLVGPPGTAKSQLARRISQALVSDGNDYFEYLLTKFSTPEELFGPLSLSELKKDNFHRKTDGYLPDVQVAFLDEIFKASSSILNALLTILNERTYHNGTQSIKTPLKTVIAASNELPEQQELLALYDRFLLRHYVDYLEQEQLGELFDSLTTTPIPEEYRLTYEDLQQLRTKAQSVSCPDPIKSTILSIWQQHKKTFADNDSEQLSDRRLVKALHLLKVSAASNGRDTLDVSDVLLLKDCLWNKPEHRAQVTSLVKNAIGGNQPNSAPVATPKPSTSGNTIKGYQGTGSQDDPLLIENINQLQRLALPEIGQQGYHFLQIADIDCSAIRSGWFSSAISKSGRFDIQDFNGYYDGDGYTITGNKSGKPLFASIKNSKIQNVSLVGVSLVDKARDSTILNCFVEANNIVLNSDNGFSFGSNSDNGFGLIACHVANTTIANCYVQGDFEVDRVSSNGAIAGNLASGIIKSCMAGYVNAKYNRSNSSSYSYNNDSFSAAISKVSDTLRKMVSGLDGRIVGNVQSSTALQNNASLLTNSSLNLQAAANGKDGANVDPSFFNQDYLEYHLGWDFDKVWQWDSDSNHPKLQRGQRSAPVTPANPQAQPTTPSTFSEQQLKDNIWIN